MKRKKHHMHDSFEKRFINMGKKETHLTAQVLYKLRDIFIQQGWDINSDNKLFDRFCDRLGILRFEEQMFVLELTERFTKIYAGDYMPLVA